MKRIFMLRIYIKFFTSIIIYILKAKFFLLRGQYILWKINRLQKKYKYYFSSLVEKSKQ